MAAAGTVFPGKTLLANLDLKPVLEPYRWPIMDRVETVLDSVNPEA